MEAMRSSTWHSGFFANLRTSPYLLTYLRHVRCNSRDKQCRATKIPLNDSFQIDIEKTLPKLENCKLMIICSPNNPTGNLINKKDIELLLNRFKGMVLIDEAYIDFSINGSIIELY